MAGGMLAFLRQRYRSARFVILEPKNVACCYKAARQADDGAQVSGVQQTIMAGLNCGTPCSVVMPTLRQGAEFFMGCPDFVAAAGMRRADKPLEGDPQYVAGESGAVGLGAIELLLTRPELARVREAMDINENSVLLTINTEGAMAPSVWRSIVREGAHPLPEA